MGYYIQTDSPIDKARYLVEEDDAEIIPIPLRFEDIPVDRALICVADNGPFEAVAYCFSPQEFEAFTLPEDKRPKVWLTMDKVKAEKLSGFN